MLAALRRRVPVLLAVVALTACTTIGPFNQSAYEQATTIKVDALALMEKATETYASHEADVTQLQTRVDKAYEYAKGRPKNEDSTNQWAIIRDPKRHSLGGFLARWRDKTKLDSDFINESKGLVSDDFDQVIALESGKDKPN
jgi:hypothetical protein